MGEVRQFMLWTEFSEKIDRYNSRTVRIGIVLNRIGDTYVVAEHLDGAGVTSFKDVAIKVEISFLDDIKASGEKLYSQLIGRIDNTLSSHIVLLDTRETSAPGKADKGLDVVLIGSVCSVEKAVGFRRKDDGFLVCCKADNAPAIEEMKERVTDTGHVLDVGTNPIIATLYKKKNTRIGHALAANHSAMVEKLLAQEE